MNEHQEDSDQVDEITALIDDSERAVSTQSALIDPVSESAMATVDSIAGQSANAALASIETLEKMANITADLPRFPIHELPQVQAIAEAGRIVDERWMNSATAEATRVQAMISEAQKSIAPSIAWHDQMIKSSLSDAVENARIESLETQQRLRRLTDDLDEEIDDPHPVDAFDLPPLDSGDPRIQEQRETNGFLAQLVESHQEQSKTQKQLVEGFEQMHRDQRAEAQRQETRHQAQQHRDTIDRRIALWSPAAWIAAVATVITLVLIVTSSG